MHKNSSMYRLLISIFAAVAISFASTTAHAEIISIDGTVKSVDAKKRTITVESGAKERTLDVSSKAKVNIDGEDSGLDGLMEGQNVTLSYHDQLEVVVKIEVSSSHPKSDDEIVLFDGKTLKGWKALDGNNTDGWNAKNGELILAPLQDTQSLVTEDKFDDFEFECEFWLDAKSNSGVFLRGRYEVQLVDDESFPQYQPNQLCGAIYGQLSPSKAVYRGPKQWNTLSVLLEGKGISVVLNGVTIIDDRNIEKVTPAAIDDREDQPGPIVLQRHTGSARFKNLKIRRKVAEVGANPKPASPQKLVRIEILRNGKWVSHSVSHKNGHQYVERFDGEKVLLRQDEKKLLFTTQFGTDFSIDIETNMSNTNEPIRLVHQ